MLKFTVVSFGEETTTVISSPEHQRILGEFKNKADAYCAKNLNRFGLDEMQKYDKMQDSLFEKEKEDTLDALRKAYSGKMEKQRTETGDLKSSLDQLHQDKETFTDKYHVLIRKAGIAFFAWLFLVLILLSWRNRMVKKSGKELNRMQTQLKNSEQLFQNGEELFVQSGQWKIKLPPFMAAASELQKQVAQVSENLPAEHSKDHSVVTLQKNSGLIFSGINRIESLLKVVDEQHGEPGTEKKPVDMNRLCDRYSDFAYSEMITTEGTFSCQLSKDFEKNLPAIKAIPEAIGSLLLNVLANAFQAVNEKSKKEIKGYIPKVSISTRVLPRFVQVRIKDNGDGIPDVIMEQVHEPFFSTREAGEGNGLGLSFSRRILTENNGEIKIESEAGNGTDVYLKFFTHS